MLQPVLLLNAVIGVLMAAVACAAIAWIRLSNSPLPRDDAGALLRQVSIVVACAAAIVIAYLWPGKRYLRSSDLLSRFLAATSAVPAAAALGALIALHRGTPARLFSDVAIAQNRFGGPLVTSAAREAWWLAALAVAAVALAAAIGYLGPNSQVEETGDSATKHIGLKALSALITACVLVFPLLNSASPPPSKPAAAQPVPREIRTAEQIAAPPTPTAISGEAAYRIDDIAGAAPALAAGPGFVAETDRHGTTSAHLNGYNGTTGELRWSFDLPEPKNSYWMSSGTGPGSAVVLVTTEAIRGIDATTGQQLWQRNLGPGPSPYVRVSSTVALIKQDPAPDAPAASATQTAVNIRTGEQLWTQTEQVDCASGWLLGEPAVAVPVCDPQQPDMAARLINPTTGSQTGEIRLSELGIDATEFRRDFGDIEYKEALGSTAILTIAQIRPSLTNTVVAVDLQTGRRLATAPPGLYPRLLSARSLALLGRGNTILDLQTQATVEIGLRSRGAADWLERPQLISIGTGWVTPLSTPSEADKKPGEPSMSPLRTIDQTGAQQVLPSACPPEQGPALGALVPGALLARCGNQIVGLR
ncbi:PQQ enzyme repeat protein [Mycobacteroides salmoniphilum]|uniref:PQQ enzyme repeat protein n=1 Tax=Mycobacteroides salmoniphilum TaxID=404941 RepID=A0A4R8S5C6_9MYCO|nr:PQQ enzyme repeat protein [Mycobacteroides salmoniphilum]